MKSRIGFLTCILLIILSLSNTVTSVDLSNHEIKPLLSIATAIKGDILGFSVQGYTIIERLEGKKSYINHLNQIVEVIGYKEPLDLDSSYFSLEDTEYAYIEWYNNNNFYRLRITAHEDKNYITLNVDGPKENDILEIYDSLKESMTFGQEIQITTSFYKELPGTMTKVEIIEEMYQGFKMVGANLVKDYEGEGNSLGLLGYSPHLKNTIESNGLKHNLHMAVNYDETTNKYHLIIANPLIESSY